MEYAILLYSEEGALPEFLPEDAREKFRVEFEAVVAAMKQAGVHRSQLRLVTSDAATTQRVRDGVLRTTDGPFAETKEALAGLLVVECEDLDQALAWAAKIPVARLGSVEVRPTRPCG